MNIMLGHAKQIVLSNLHNIHKLLQNIFVLPTHSKILSGGKIGDFIRYIFQH